MAETNQQAEFGRYRLIRPLGRGGMAEVHLAESVGPMNFRKQVAIKRLLPQYAQNKRYVQMLMDEARIAGSINHPNVVQVIDLGQVDAAHYIAMEFVHGVDLACVLQTLRMQQRPLPLSVALHIARCVGRGLHAAHTLVDADGHPMRVVHRDVSPHNVLLSMDGEVKLIDFGVAKAETNLTMTRSGVIKGKLQYMSPEQARAEPVDCRADVFSLGMTLYKMLVGRLPFSGTNEFQIYDEILRKKAAPPSLHRPEVPERVDALVLRALRKLADERFQTADEMARVIDRALAALEPGYGAPELAAWLAHDLPQDQRFSPPEDDDFRSLDDPTPAPIAAGSFDDARIERLTRIEEGEALVPTVRAAIDGRSRERRAGAAPVHDEPPPTMQLSIVPTVSAEVPQTTAETDPTGGAVRAEVPVMPAPSGPTTTRRSFWVMLGVIVALAVTLVVLVAQESGDAVRPTVVRVAPTPETASPPTDSPSQTPPTSPPSVVTSPPTRPPVAATPIPATAPMSTASASAPRVADVPTKAWLTVSTLPWAWVHVDGQRLARHTPVVNFAVKPGRHQVLLVSGDGREHSVEINLKPGQRLTVSHAFK